MKTVERVGEEGHIKYNQDEKMKVALRLNEKRIPVVGHLERNCNPNDADISDNKYH